MLGNNQNSNSSVSAGLVEEDRLHDIHLDKIIPNPLQPRRYYEDGAIDILVASIKRIGLIHPIIVRPRNDKFIIVAGEMRWRAFQKLGRKTIKAVIQAEDDVPADEMALAENMVRTNLSLLDEINAIDDHSKCGKTEEEMAVITSRSVRHIQRVKKVWKFFEELQSRCSIDYMMLDKACKRYGLYSLEQAAKMGLDGGDYSGAWDLLQKENSFDDITEAAELAVIEAQERKAEPAEPAPLPDPADEPAETSPADIAGDIAAPVAADREDGAFDFTEFDPKDVLEEEGDSGENDTKHTQNRVPPNGEAIETAPPAPEGTSSVPVESDGIKKVSDRAILKSLGKLKDALEGLEALGITNGAVMKVRPDRRDQLSDIIKSIDEMLPVVEPSISAIKLSIVELV